MTRADSEHEVLKRYSPRLVRWFARWLRGYFRRNFDGVRLACAGAPPGPTDDPLIVYTNHPSWWDPIHFLLLARIVMPGRRMFGPFDAEALAKYPLFRRLGGFGIERSTRRGAVEFLRASRAVLASPDHSLWITAQGEFSDPRTRPVVLQPGLAHLVRELERGVVLPLAVEYPFWNERRPVALSFFGRPMQAADLGTDSVEQLNEFLARRLEETLDALGHEAATRDPARFRTLVLGRAGVGGVYDAGRRLKAWITGRSFDSAHGDHRR
jgi:1-acyl-sn-glycerol-3-phosphate acyltransferase